MFEIYTEMYRKSIKKLLLTYLECSPVLFIKPNITQIIKSYCQEIAELLTQGHIIKSWKKKNIHSNFKGYEITQIPTQLCEVTASS